jgi:hypothetical protein
MDLSAFDLTGEPFKLHINPSTLKTSQVRKGGLPPLRFARYKIEFVRGPRTTLTKRDKCLMDHVT